ncbi:MAG TPA: helix-turn-helix transcriptional regulator [Opitutales bacterium]|nr:helix-turn-helix transcriptional regulator [Opitutales bacterium]
MKNHLRVLRAEFNLSQAELADRVGVARQTIIALEAGKYAPSLPLAFKLSMVFDKPVEAVFIPESSDSSDG